MILHDYHRTCALDTNNIKQLEWELKMWCFSNGRFDIDLADICLISVWRGSALFDYVKIQDRI